ncbi:MAG: Putative secreted protein [uncultured Sulfurovum sp.]|uniref:Secreted protein n=1 Tax=uncultured Sulfurovum sp. TaxID=269237 RepID=A0A6S6TN60_9BACT|nr:MAG: Putative secreted protein [uncultured Sulfurovum sp.]
MTNTKLFNISILSSLLFFSACSDSQSKVKAKQVSIYNIMGITEANNNFSKQQTYPQSNISDDVTYISYKKRIHPNENKLQVIQSIENKAKSFLGVPYVWGATGPSKFDCSGFTQWVYRDVGINIPRVSRQQARVGQFVSYANLQRGDMVFFDTKKKRTGRVSHVGIYLGNGDFIHASSAGKSVVIYNFNQKKFYKKRFLWGRRVLNPDFHYALN